MKKILTSLCFALHVFSFYASTVDTLMVYSPSMKKEIKTCVVTPTTYGSAVTPFPVVYLLHGYSGNYASWVNDFPMVKEYADRYNVIVVGVDGAFSSWYFDSPIDPTMCYETFVAIELVNFIDTHFKTVNKPSARAIAGLSMGGHGALYLAVRHQDIFGSAGSMSGGVDFTAFPKKWDLSKRLGDKDTFPENWEQHTVIAQFKAINVSQLNLIIDCGIDDFFMPANRLLHEELLRLKVKHDYIERPGNHSKPYWSNAIEYQFLFLTNCFKEGM